LKLTKLKPFVYTFPFVYTYIARTKKISKSIRFKVLLNWINTPKSKDDQIIKHSFLIEDDTIEVMKFNRVLHKLDLNHKIIANNGEEALNHGLKAQNSNSDIIILDLNMPKTNGIEFFANSRQTHHLKYIPADCFIMNI
jgi:response regulator RpfG family c-di-GMP phosphodiesterase